MSDTEQEWKPKNRRPQSTMAQAFSLALDNAFMLDSEVDTLNQSIEQKRQMMTIQARELEALQAKIRAAEQRLQQRKSRDGSPSGRHESASHREKTGRSQDPGPHDDNEKARAQSPLSSALSDGHRSDGGFTDSSTSAATSNDFDEAEEEEDDSKGKARQS